MSLKNMAFQTSCKKKVEDSIRLTQEIIYEGHKDVLLLIPNANDFCVLQIVLKERKKFQSAHIDL